MSTEPAPEPWSEVVGPDVSHLITEDGAPVDNVYSERQMRLLVEPLYASWSGPPPDEEGQPRSFFAAANVGLFAVAKNNPLVPDVLLSVDVEPPRDVFDKEHRSYFVWEFGKVPDVVIEVVSNKQGGELTDRKRGYARMRVPLYVVWDPQTLLSDRALSVFELRGAAYQRIESTCFESIGLRLTEWNGCYEGVDERWLRWSDRDGALLATGVERAEFERARADTERAHAEAERARAEAERARAEAERARAEAERARAETERARAEALAAKLRAMGIDPNELE
jgi:hypothetical protein